MVAVSLAAASCTAPGAAQGNGGGEARLKVVASFYPLAEAARRVGAGCVDVTNLTPPGVEPHDLELSPDAVEAVVTADVLVYLGSGFQPALEEAVGEAGGAVVDVLEDQGTISAGAGDELELDPHVWLDPARFARIVDRVARAIEAAGAPSACEVSARATAFRDELALLDAEFATGLARCRGNLIVTNHAAFGYLAAAYGLRQQAISGLGPEAEPDARRLAELKTLVEREHVSTIFTEELAPPDVAETLASEAGVRTAVLRTIEGAGTSEEVANDGGGYLSAMRENLRVLRRALGCS